MGPLAEFDSRHGQARLRYLGRRATVRPVMTPSSKPAPAAEHAEEVLSEVPEAPAWMHEDCVQYEVARESVTALMGFRSSWIDLEEQKPVPDLAAIARWSAERSAYARQLRGLDVRDRERMVQLCREYGAEVRRLYDQGNDPP